MQLNVKADGVDAAVAALAEQFSQRRLSAALATGVTHTAQQVRDAWVDEMRAKLDRPTPYTLRSVFLSAATAQRPEAVVWLKDDRAGSGTPATKYLMPQIVGGAREQKRFERSLQAAGAMPTGWRAVPAAGAVLDGYGNISRGQINQILSQVGTELTAGYNRTVPKGKDADSRKKQIAAYRRAGAQYFALPRGRGRLKPGIYAREFYGKNITPVVIFVPAVGYMPRLDFMGVGERVASANLGANINKAIEESYQKMMTAGNQLKFGGF